VTLVIARTVRGLEWVAADEVAARLPHASDVTMSPRQLTFELAGPLDDRLRALQTVDDLFIRVGEVGGVGATKDVPADLARRLARLDWRTAVRAVRAFRDLPRNPRFDVVASLAGRRRFSRYDVENSLGPLLEKPFSGTHYARDSAVAPETGLDLNARVFLNDDRAVAAVRLAARPLHRRAYKLDTGPGTLHPPVAAALARLAAVGTGMLVDPFCGDGTIAIEAALMDPGSRVLAGDADPARVANARGNAVRAGVTVDLREADAADVWWPPDTQCLVTNPPWNRAVGAAGRLAQDIDRFLRGLPDTLALDARLALIADVAMAAPTRMSGVVLATQVRLAGHVSHIVVCGQSLPTGLNSQRQRALAEGLITEEGW
jgi:tRNA (guanine6-N2)-methyltransferase